MVKHDTMFNFTVFEDRMVVMLVNGLTCCSQCDDLSPIMAGPRTTLLIISAPRSTVPDDQPTVSIYIAGYMMGQFGQHPVIRL